MPAEYPDESNNYLRDYDFNYGLNLPPVDIDVIPQVGVNDNPATPALQTTMVKKLAFGAAMLFVLYKVL